LKLDLLHVLQSLWRRLKGIVMSLNPALLEILCCPETGEKLQEMYGEPFEALNRDLESGTKENRRGEKQTAAWEGALIRRDGKLVFPVRNGIPVLLLDEAVELG
jgi:uncharacterized protein YbaR (Trm112 family)